MKKQNKMLIELVRKEATEMGAIPIMESIKLAKDFGDLAKKSGYDCYVKGYPKEKLDYKPTGKKYKIKTVEDIADLTAEKFEFFIDDLRSFCEVQRGLKAINEITGAIEKEEKGFTWLDTGLNEGIFNIKVSNKI